MLGYYRAVLEDMKQNSELTDHLLKAPVLALGGDAGSAPDLHESLLPLCANIRGGVIKNSGHYIPEEQPEALAREIIGFMAILEA
jgi:pimeloyl-ACP methyl ester carboxylesterase